ncbi:hypothetical protein [Parasphingorhabdus halotolerans]|uniref:Uncharacterized protein n=1 Tax=Parasphingorhabdus halotolerans TaxID=2725558 RepID=A0A6H2DPK7_9SPHN|nr:hypothetical protein [Parasphingorhabdus halotolerans]QJB69691.1 hypothetical protein HF685_10715 [Parasphingorhabdus halotolerans]
MAGFGFGFGSRQSPTAVQAGNHPGADLIPAGTKLYVVGDSLSYAEQDSFPSGYITWLIGEADGRFIFPSTTNPGVGDGSGTTGGNMAIKGQAPSGYAARAVAIANVVDDGILILGGIENGPGSAADEWAHFDAVISACSAARKIYITPVAPTKSTYLDGGIRKAEFDAMAAADGRVTFLSNCWAGIELATSATTTGVHSYDTPGVHQTPLGAKLQAANMWAQMAPDWKTGSAYDQFEIADNFMAAESYLTGDSGGLASGYSLVNPSGAAISPSKGVLRDWNSQVLEISGTAASTSICSIRNNGFAHNFVAGDIIQGVMALKISNLAGDGPPVGLRSIGGPSFYYNKVRWGSQYYASGAQGSLSPAADIDYIVRSRNPSTADVVSSGNGLNFDMPFSLVPGLADCRIEIARPMGFNLTQLGLD